MDWKTEVKDGMRIEWDVPIPMKDGIALRADVFRPLKDGKFPVIMTMGPYGKGLAFQEGYPDQWQKMVADHPDVTEGSTSKYQSWEVPDPERWVPEGYVVVRIDSRGAGRSPGFLNPHSPEETVDLYQCIEWAAAQPWSTGKVGMLGISYHALNQWRVAAMQPPHLAAIVPWEGASNYYRERAYHGGIMCVFPLNWMKKQVISIQHGYGERGYKNPNTGEYVAGPETLSMEELMKNRAAPRAGIPEHPLDDEFHRSRTAEFSKITIPILTSANWGGQGLHLRGNIEGFLNAASKDKWIEVHGREHWTEFYTRYGITLQKRFLDRFLKGIDNDWKKQPRVQLNIRHPGEKFVLRHENEWPPARTHWTRFYLNPGDLSLRREPVKIRGSVTYEGLGDGVTFFTPPLEGETEITGPVASKLFVSSSTTDADLFLVLRLFDPNGSEVVFAGALDPHTPIGQGWLRASHRRLDPKLSTEYRPYHTHDRVEALTPGEVYELDVEIWPTCVVIPAGYRIGLTVRGRDYEYAGETAQLKTVANVMKGCGPFIHNDPEDRPPDIFGGEVTLHAGEDKEAYLLLPVIP